MIPVADTLKKFPIKHERIYASLPYAVRTQVDYSSIGFTAAPIISVYCIQDGFGADGANIVVTNITKDGCTVFQKNTSSAQMVVYVDVLGV